MGEFVAESERLFFIDATDQVLELSVHFVRNLHVLDVNVPSDLLERLSDVEAGHWVQSNLEFITLVNCLFASFHFYFRFRIVPVRIDNALCLGLVIDVPMDTFVAELGAINASEATSAAVVARLARLQHQVWRHDKLHVSICLTLFF